MTKIVKKRFKIEDMKCTSCSIVIDGDLEDLEGIENSTTNYAKAETEVEFNPDKINPKRIVETIKKTGYQALPLD